MEGARSRPEGNTLTASLQRRAETFEVQHVFMCIMSMMGATQFKLLNSRLVKRFLNHANHETNAEGDGVKSPKHCSPFVGGFVL